MPSGYWPAARCRCGKKHKPRQGTAGVGKAAFNRPTVATSRPVSPHSAPPWYLVLHGDSCEPAGRSEAGEFRVAMDFLPRRKLVLSARFRCAADLESQKR